MKAFVDKHEMRGAPRDLLLALMTTTDLPTMKKLVLATGDEKLSQALEMLEALNYLTRQRFARFTMIFPWYLRWDTILG
ncbi:hypothetical protein ICE98_00343 [Lactococcus lactis]|nr:hypothetical protein [Lactococcus lactis]